MARPLRRCAVWLIAIFAHLEALPSHAQDVRPLWHDLEPGSYGVGFRTEFIVDSSRSFEGIDGFQGRPIRLLIWYPARRERAATEALGVYFDVQPSDDRFTPYNELLRERDTRVGQRQFTPPSDTMLMTVRDTMVPVTRNASPEPGPFPLVLHALGRNNFQQESTVLWEYLASHGYIVVAVPQAGPGVAEFRMDFTADALRLQASDVVAALHFMETAESVDASRVGLLGHSSGGVVALLAVQSRRDIDAVVGLDASFATGDGVAMLSELGVDAANLPLLNLYAKGKRGLDRRLTRLFLDYALGGDREARSSLTGASPPPGLPEDLVDFNPSPSVD